MSSSDVKISVITVCFNSEETVVHTIRSVNAQTYTNVEHVFIDGGSSDKTVAVIEAVSQRSKVLISEPDRGIYDAMNKGFAVSTGDVVCFLNSDDVFADENVLTKVAGCFEASKCEVAYGNIRLVNKKGAIIRDWVVGRQSFSPKIFQPQLPHPAMFVARALMDRITGPFDDSMRIAADLKLQLMLVKLSASMPVYLDLLVVNMLVGGASTGSLSAQLLGWRETARSWRDVYGGTGVLYLSQKVLRKLTQFSIGSLRN